jgi:hypothetical protein
VDLVGRSEELREEAQEDVVMFRNLPIPVVGKTWIQAWILRGKSKSK